MVKWCTTYVPRTIKTLMQGFPWGTKIGKSPISDLCTEIVLFWWDFYLQGQHWDFGQALSLEIPGPRKPWGAWEQGNCSCESLENAWCAAGWKLQFHCKLSLNFVSKFIFMIEINLEVQILPLKQRVLKRNKNTKKLQNFAAWSLEN